VNGSFAPLPAQSRQYLQTSVVRLGSSQDPRRRLSRFEARVAGDAGDEALAAVFERQERLAAHRLDDENARLRRRRRRATS
jgi:hypothetical protein